jgi:hypothetical protein
VRESIREPEVVKEWERAGESRREQERAGEREHRLCVCERERESESKRDQEVVGKNGREQDREEGRAGLRMGERGERAGTSVTD